jgi:hypothetical protein
MPNEKQYVFQMSNMKKKKAGWKRCCGVLFTVCLTLAISACGSPHSAPGRTPEPSKPVPTAIQTPAQEPTQEAEPAAEPTPEPPAAVPENEIRPEVKEFLDAYEACMDEYADFMQKYMSADPTSMLSMMGEYYSILARYTEFAEKIDAFDERELTNAELAYYLEVTNRVSQKLLRVAG